MDLRSVRRQLRSARRTASWAREHPEVLRDLALGLLPGRGAPSGSPAAAAGDHEVPEQIAAYDRTISATTDSPASPAQVRALLDDLSLLPQWMVMHDGWRGDAPTAAVEGATFVERVKLMGIPADLAWTVAHADATSVSMSGVGPMGLTIGLWFSVQPDGAGSRLWVDAGMGGDPVKGPMGASVSRTVQDAMQTSLEKLAALLAEGVEAGPAAAGRILHHASGTQLDPRTPVIVGVGQVTQRTPDVRRDPASLAVEALTLAGADSGAARLLREADAVYAVATTSWTYRDQAALVAKALGAKPAATIQSVRFGGDAGQLLVNTAGQAIADGESSVALVFGSEAGSSLAAAQKDGIEPRWPEQPADVRPTRVLGDDREANNEAEANAGLGAPVYMYALMESALRGKAGSTIAEHQGRITRLWSGLSKVAAANPHAWLAKAFTPEQLATTGQDNRMVSAPYPKLLCANLQVDQASGLILCSAAAAEAAGVPQDKWVFLHAGAAAHDEWFVSERGDLAASPAIRTIGAAALEHAGIGIDDVGHVDLYSCFPAAVQIAAAELGLPIDDEARPLSVTGGLTFGGGPGNNYGGHAVATLVGRLRDDPTAYGLSTSLGWYATKHAIGIYSAQPPRRPYRALKPLMAPSPTRPAPTSYAGPAVVEAFTVQFGRDGEPAALIVSALAPGGERVLVRTTDLLDLADEDLIGWTVDVQGPASLTVTNRGRSDLPPPPPMTVLVEDRGPVRIITLNRPERRNAIDLATAQLLERVIDGFEADPSVRVAVLTGAGGSFCAGMDLKAAATGQFALTERRGPLGIAGLPIAKPVIAAVEGHALAGGCELALVADLIVASTESQFGLPEPKRGLVAAAGGVLRLSQRLPRNIAMELALTGEPMPATRLAELGLVNRLADPGKVLDAALDLAGQIVVNAPLSVAASKQIIEQAPDWSSDEEFQRQTDVAGVALVSEDAGEGVRAFAEKRAPVWAGR